MNIPFWYTGKGEEGNVIYVDFSCHNRAKLIKNEGEDE
jgi:hypothetical protein